jgi:hypothetical protein
MSNVPKKLVAGPIKMTPLKNIFFECTPDVINYVHYKHASNGLKPFFSKNARSPAYQPLLCPFSLHIFHESCKCIIKRINSESA